ncbi:pectin lyase fold/virulence factor [Penicillium chermesinum]|uniref:galacturonan 1,4-alpha-galacturonidase n=1 Tax=Penicillium chermesinum TaxID=63820 RepID=A0A9W9P889_9EURO|nr:pectin lyase fold/virulence factor [Penicillium chermesinum]KAJ5239690.1 pectin lyase fold/virulence factor [Penicillium chermesinum]KAJ6166577.1 pectin lyase fold/virulence factor [Penicillium chermesinum]
MNWWFLALWTTLVKGWVVNEGTTCTLYPESLIYKGQAVDDAPSIQQAFDLCGTNGTVIFSENLFHVNSVLNTTNLLNVDVHLRGELRFSSNIPYWRTHAISVILQDQVTAWLFGGTNVTFHGEGGFYNGNGQEWYNANRNQSNQPGRPISFTVYDSTNLLVDNLRVIGPQFWATFVWDSKNVSFTNLFVNATSDSEWGTMNCDGYDSWKSDDLLVENATIITGDDCIAAKGNTTNLLAKNIYCEGGTGVTIGSIGQYAETPDYNMNITFQNVTVKNAMDGAYVKTWQGSRTWVPSNGDYGGGGSGLVKNVTFKDFELINVGLPIQLSQCVYSDNSDKGCNTSKLAVEDVKWQNIHGTSRFNIAASVYCSDVHPCPGIEFENINITSVNASLGLPYYDTDVDHLIWQCTNLLDQKHTGIPCNQAAPSNFSQWIYSNVDHTGLARSSA